MEITLARLPKKLLHASFHSHLSLSAEKIPEKQNKM
jgi:hypothetical protein